MSKLFLSGGGHANKTKKLDSFFEANIPKNKPMLYIPIAMPQKVYTYGQCYDWIKVVFPTLQIDMWTDLTGRKFDYLSQYGAIFFGGGNTYYLLNHIRKTKFDKVLEKYYTSGGMIYGGSAGAIILGKDIHTAGFGGDADRNEVGIKELDGLNFVNGYSVQCHYTSYDDAGLMQYSKKLKVNVIALPDDTGLVVDGKKMTIIGESNAVVFTKTSKVVYIPNSSI